MPPKAQVAKTGATGAIPNQTLYVRNIPEKIKKPELRRLLYVLFATYGPVIDVVVTQRIKMHGQAHIAMRDIATSTQAMRALQGFEFFGKELHVEYAKGKSQKVAKLDGTYKMPTPDQSKQAATTEAQMSIFNAPPSSTLPSKPQTGGVLKPRIPSPGRSKDTEMKDQEEKDTTAEEGTKGPQGVKRVREEESDEDDAPMDEDEDEAMEESDDE